MDQKHRQAAKKRRKPRRNETFTEPYFYTMTLLETFTHYIYPHRNLVRQIVKRWCPPADRDEAYQDCLVHLWEVLPRFRPEGGKIEAWISTVVRHHLHRRHHEAQRNTTLSLDAPTAEGFCLLDTLADPDSQWELPNSQLLAETQRDDSRLVEQLLDLPPAQRQALWMAAQGCSLRDIAQELRCTLMQAGKLCYRGRKQLRRWMEKRD